MATTAAHHENAGESWAGEHSLAPVPEE
ncbi:MAG: hypothetical protein QOH75_3480, partial [Actinomycetota bacterium]|nr:hypothetical protein [Actinomycetota bacterium]MDQ1667449.1 hypothetical protein [Actinomycetota bacterium]